MGVVTEKFNKIAVEFTTRIGDPCSVSGSVIQPNKNLTVAEIESYINRAMDKLFTDSWAELKEDEFAMLARFPELMKTQTGGNITGGLSSSLPDHFKLVSCWLGSTNVKIFDMSVYDIVKTGSMTQYQTSSDNIGVIDKNGTLEFFGISSSSDLSISYIQKPLRVDGSFFVSSANGEDIPFSQIWNNTISDIAEQLYRTDAQENS